MAGVSSHALQRGAQKRKALSEVAEEEAVEPGELATTGGGGLRRRRRARLPTVCFWRSNERTWGARRPPRAACFERGTLELITNSIRSIEKHSMERASDIAYLREIVHYLRPIKLLESPHALWDLAAVGRARPTLSTHP